jgi:hypothetical protein
MLQDRFPQAGITKHGKRLEGTALTMNPDLVVGSGSAIADVKYKVSQGDWNRPDLYQLVTFATAFRSKAGALVNFVPAGAAELTSLRIGDISVHHVAWPADAALTADEAARRCSSSASRWLGQLGIAA